LLVDVAARVQLRASASAKFDGEFAGSSQLYAGTGTLRHTW